jgi:hypothetical protein
LVSWRPAVELPPLSVPPAPLCVPTDNRYVVGTPVNARPTQHSQRYTHALTPPDQHDAAATPRDHLGACQFDGLRRALAPAASVRVIRRSPDARKMNSPAHQCLLPAPMEANVR